MKCMKVGSLVIVDSSTGISTKVNVYPQPVATKNCFFVYIGTYGIILEIGAPKSGTFFGEVLVMFDNGKHGWISQIYLRNA